MEKTCLKLLRALVRNKGVLTFEQVDKITGGKYGYVWQNPYVREIRECVEQVYTGETDDSGIALTEDKIQITVKGRAAYQSLKSQRILLVWTEIRAWVTLAIAIAALVLSIANANIC